VFKNLGWLLFWLVVGSFPLQGLFIGRLLDYGTRSGAGGFVGLVIGGAVGFVVASWIFGVIHLLISVNDNSAKLVALQQRTIDLLERGSGSLGTPNAQPVPAAGQTASETIAAETGGSTSRSSAEPAVNGGPESQTTTLNFENARRLLEANRYSVADSSSRFKAKELLTPEGATLQA
jgi:hypothetical protein